MTEIKTYTLEELEKDKLLIGIGKLELSEDVIPAIKWLNLNGFFIFLMETDNGKIVTPDQLDSTNELINIYFGRI